MSGQGDGHGCYFGAMDRRAKQKAAMRRALEDPLISASKRANLERRLGILPTLDESLLVAPLSEEKHRNLATYLERMGFTRVEGRRRPGLTPPLTAIHALAGLGAILDDGFWDYSDEALAAFANEDDELPDPLQLERDNLVMSLRMVALEIVADEFEAAWAHEDFGGPELEALQEKYWGEAFRQNLLHRVNALVAAERESIVGLGAS